MLENKTVDMLYRDGFLKKIENEINYLDLNNENAFFIIDGKWGSGKTFIMNMLKERLQEKYNVIDYNCWENSFYSDPLIAIISTITEQLNEYSDINNIGLKLMNYFGFSFSSVSYMGINIDLGKKYPNEAYLSLETYVKKFKNSFADFNKNNLGIDNKKTKIILVDELDRCRPKYAIMVLERLYLLFKDMPNVVVIIGSNNEQLKESIKHIFGNIDVDKYLQKFIDKVFTISYDQINYEKIFEKYKTFFGMFHVTKNIYFENGLKFLSVILARDTPREQERKFRFIIQKHKEIFGNNKESFSVALYEIMCMFISFDEIELLLKNRIKLNEEEELILNVLPKLENNNYNSNVVKKDYLAECMQMYLRTHFTIQDESIKNSFEKSYINNDVELIKKLCLIFK